MKDRLKNFLETLDDEQVEELNEILKLANSEKRSDKTGILVDRDMADETMTCGAMWAYTLLGIGAQVESEHWSRQPEDDDDDEDTEEEEVEELQAA